MLSQYSARLKLIEENLHKNLPNSFSDNWKKNTFGTLSPAVNKTHIESLSIPCKNLLNLGGKRWRPLFMVLCSEMAEHKGSALANVYSLVPLVEFVHTASLIHDDIEDAADTRRGKPAAHCTYGIDRSLNSASWLYFHAFSVIDTLENESLKCNLYNALSVELRRLHLGQAMDIKWHNNNTSIPTTEEYSAMVSMKTGTLASLAAKAGILCGGGTIKDAEKVAKIASNIGIGFQILDDYINLTTGNKGKKRGDDIVEGKKSLPILMYLEEKKESFDSIMNLLSQASKEGISSPAVEECIKLIEKTDILNRVKEKSINLINNSCKELQKLYPTQKEKSDPVFLIEKLFMTILKAQ